MVRAEMQKRYGDSYSTDGYIVVTSLDSRMQKAANYALRNGLLEFTRRRGYRGPIQNVELTEQWLATPFGTALLQRETRVVEEPGGALRVLVGGHMLVSPSKASQLEVQSDPTAGATSLRMGAKGPLLAVEGGRSGGLTQLLLDRRGQPGGGHHPFTGQSDGKNDRWWS